MVHDTPALRLGEETMNDENYTCLLNVHLQTDATAVKAWAEQLFHRLYDAGILYVLDCFEADSD